METAGRAVGRGARASATRTGCATACCRRRARAQRRRWLGAGAGAPPARGAGVGRRRRRAEGAELREAMARAGARPKACARSRPTAPGRASALAGGCAARHRRRRRRPGRRWPRCSSGMLDLELPLVAIDGPTGVDLRTGIVHGAAAGRSHRDLRRAPPRAPARAGRGGRRRRGGHRPSAAPIPAWPALVTDAHAAGVAAPASAPAITRATRGRVVVVGGRCRDDRRGADGGRARRSRRGRGWFTSSPRRTRWPRWCRRSPISRPWPSAFDRPPAPALLELVAQRRCRGDRPRARPRGGAPGAGGGAGGAAPGRSCSMRTRWSPFRAPADELGALAAGAARGAHAAPGRVPHPLSRRCAAERELDPWAAAARAARGGRRRRCCSRACPRVVARRARHAAHRGRRQPRARDRRKRRRAQRTHRHRARAGCSPDRRPRRWAPRRSAAPPTSRPAGSSARGPCGRWTWWPRLPDLWREWELLRAARRAAPRPPVLLELDPAPDGLTSRASHPLRSRFPMRISSRRCSSPSPPRRPAAQTPSRDWRLAGSHRHRRLQPDHLRRRRARPGLRHLADRGAHLASPVPHLGRALRSAAGRSRSRGVFGGLVDPLDKSLWLARPNGWMHFQPELQLWDQGLVPGGVVTHRVRRRTTRCRGCTSGPARGGSCCRAAARWRRPSRPARAAAHAGHASTRCCARARPCRPTPPRS